MVATRRLYLTSVALGILAVVCLVVAFARRHSIHDVLSGVVDGAYLNRSSGSRDFSFVTSGNVLDPFHPLNSYLWLGAAVAFALAAGILLLVTRLSRSTTPGR